MTLSMQSILLLISVTALVEGKTSSFLELPLYSELKCFEIWNTTLNEKYPLKYDCSDIHNRPKDTCHYRGKIYQVGKTIVDEDLSDVWERHCVCEKSLEFKCDLPLDGCAEHWVGGYPEPGCYLKYELGGFCAAGQICPPFEENKQCDVGDVTYKKGEKFRPPNDNCRECVCDDSFDGNFEAPNCQPVNCTAELKNSNYIDKFWAPYYKDDSSCCPSGWIPPSEKATFLPSPLGFKPHLPVSEYHCKFGDRIIEVDTYYKFEDKELGGVNCVCRIPPFLTCMEVK